MKWRRSYEKRNGVAYLNGVMHIKWAKNLGENKITLKNGENLREI